MNSELYPLSMICYFALIPIHEAWHMVAAKAQGLIIVAYELIGMSPYVEVNVGTPLFFITPLVMNTLLLLLLMRGERDDNRIFYKVLLITTMMGSIFDVTIFFRILVL